MNDVSLLASSYNAWLIALSVIIAIGASYAALDMAARTSATSGQIRRLWLAGGATAMGGGIWSMHYIGMLAFSLSVPVFYELPLVALSLLAAIAASAAALFVLSRATMGAVPLVIGSLVMGAAISAMHYIGMSSMRMAAHNSWNITVVALSVVIAVAVSFVALWLAWGLRTEQRALAPQKIGSAVIMGFAIAAMHYTGMAAATFHSSGAPVDTTDVVTVSTLGVVGITLVTFLVLALAIIASIVDRRFTHQTLVFMAGKERHRSMIERSLAGVYWSTPTGRIVDCNEAFARIFGYPSRDALLNGPASALYADIAGRQRFIADLARERTLRDYESWLARRDGTPLCVIENATLLDEPDGSQVIEGTLIDITARKLTEDHLRASEMRLRAEIAERERMEVALHLKQRLESVGQLAAGIAHEINTPVQFVNDSVQFIRDSMLEFHTLIDAYRRMQIAVLADAPAKSIARETMEIEESIDLEYLLQNGPEALDRAVDGLQRIATIVRSMKEFAHPDQVEMSYVDLNRAVKTTLEVARNEYRYIADLTTELSELPPVKCHAGEINQVVLNLVVNAAHAIADLQGPSGERGRIDVATRQDGDDILLEVRDTGCGIPDAIRNRIFDPFFTTKEVGRGTGQGLAISRSIVVEKHGGSLQMESSVGQGTTFVVRLPLNGPRAAAA